MLQYPKPRCQLGKDFCNYNRTVVEVTILKNISTSLIFQNSCKTVYNFYISISNFLYYHKRGLYLDKFTQVII